MKSQTIKSLIIGVEDVNIPAICGEFLEQGRPVIIVVASFAIGERIKTGLEFFCPNRQVFLCVDEDPFFLQYEARSNASLLSRSKMTEAMLESVAQSKSDDHIYILPVSAFVRRLMPVADYVSLIMTLKVGETYELSKISQSLVKNGYARSAVVEMPGQFAIRGDILDIYLLGESHPLRLDFFDITLESIRAFDAQSQKSIGAKIDEVQVFPVSDDLLDGLGHFYDEPATIIDYLTYNSLQKGKLASFDLVVVEEDSLASSLDLAYRDANDDYKELLLTDKVKADSFSHYPPDKTVPEFIEKLDLRHVNIYGISQIGTVNADYYHEKRTVNIKQPIRLNGSLPLLLSELKRYEKQRMQVEIVFSSQEKLKSLQEFILENKLEKNVKLSQGVLELGVELLDKKRVYLWEGDIFKHIKKKRTRFKSDNTEQIRSFLDIKPGDYVVHENHGIGRYSGIVSLTVDGNTSDFLKIAYAGSDILYVPMEQLGHIGKYIGGRENPPRISSLTTDTWKQTKRRAGENAMKLAVDLIELGAKRRARKGYAFSVDTAWQKDFEDAFIYEETEDQERAVVAIKADMEKPVPMDRLLCGDVGYGKTEVALRAIFKCIADGKQAAVLVPTTVLAGQHEQTFQARLEGFPFSVKALSRFKSKHEQKNILSSLNSGQLDVIIGTHRLLSKDVKFKDLGLLVIDEEHKFGVSHKEKIKQLKENVDVLTLTATPIPRTLNMSLIGIRDMDLIETPPEERYPVQTYVSPENPEIIREIIVRELDRGGQVFVVVPRISGINRIVDIITTILPNANFATAHGQMSPNSLEDIMLDFTGGRYDILISTSIIESGLDIPRANTIIVVDSDRFGLSQLYQMRGRVGRSNTMAFAYFTHKTGKQLSEVAIERLRAIREFTQLGAGFKLAMRDLEIRGAGNILGAEQSGHMSQVGYELYVRLIEDAIAELKGEQGDRPGGETEVVLHLGESAFIPQTYIDSEELRLDMYRRISHICEISEIGELLSEFSDRFSKPPLEVEALLYASYISKRAGKLGIEEIKRTDKMVAFTYRESGFEPKTLQKIPQKYQLFLEINAGKKVEVSIEIDMNLADLADLLREIG